MAKQGSNGDFTLDKALPSSVEAERLILGVALLDNTAINQAAENLKPDDFFLGSNRRIYEKMLALYERGQAIDPLTLQEELRRAGELEKVGGPAYIAALFDGVPRFSNIENYVELVKGKSMLRRLITSANQIMAMAFDDEEEPEEILDRAESLILSIGEDRIKQGFVHIGDVATRQLTVIEETAGREQLITGLATGFSDLDYMTSGLQRGDLIILAARPSMGKCVSADSEITLADGSVTTIEHIYRACEASLLTLRDDFTFNFTHPVGFIDDGVKPVFRLTTRLGRAVECTLSHPFLTIDGWRPLSTIRPGERIAVPRQVAVFGRGQMRECEVKILGYLIGDGCLMGGLPELSAANPVLRDDFGRAVAEFGGVEVVPVKRSQRIVGLRVRRSNPQGQERNTLRAWLESLGLYGCDDHAKFIPAPIFTLPRDLLSIFLNRLFATDPWACVLKCDQAQVGYATVSERLARQVQHLLLRFGVIASLKKRSIKYKGSHRPSWRLDITDSKSIRTFISEIGIFGKEERLAAALVSLENRKRQTNCDLEIWDRIAQAKCGESWSPLAQRAWRKGYTNIHAGKRALTRGRLGKLASALNSSPLQDLAKSEVYWDEVISIDPIGNKQVYDLTIPETHNFVANDICVHNTAFSLNIAQNAATRPQYNGEKAVVGVFSLEMSNEQLVNRLLCSQARVDAHRLRSGYLSKDEWRRLAMAVGELAETKIYLDDTPGISVLEMRAKARRLKNEQKALDLLIIDYLQLMSGRGRNESRQQEVSQISRELKMLAKELNVPLVALSQLSRAPETRTGSHKPQLSDLRESGCLAGESLVTMADNGAQIPIRDLVGKSGFKVWALNESNFRLEPAVVSRAFATGVKPVFRLTTRLGRTIRATANHKFRAFAGWKRLDELTVGEHLALPRVIENPSRQSMSNDELALLGHLIGDSCTLPRHVIQYTTREKDLAEIVAELAMKVFGGEVNPRISQERKWYQVYLTSTRHHTHNVHSAITEWLSDLGVWGLRSYEKRIPAKVFEQPAAAIGVFLRHLWATDGSIKYFGALHYPGIYYASSSVDLGSGVQSLLLRLGINATISRHSQNGKGRDQYYVTVSGKPDLEKFIDHIGALGNSKTVNLSSIAESMSGRPSKTNRDVLPREVWSVTVLPAMRQHNMTAEQIRMTLGNIPHFRTIRSQNMSRDRAARVAQAIRLEALTKLAHSDVYWDKIVSIEPDGEADVYDLTVREMHNFVANNFFVHNSLEQDADVVMFIYREEVYKPETEKQNIAEIIIGKQRNGPIGSVELIFLKQLTRFEDKYREQT